MAHTTKSPGILTLPVRKTPIAVVDTETTGLSPGRDRVVELSVVRLDPGRAPYLAFDTLIDPDRPVAATAIHGITDEDVYGAPEFHEVAGEFLRAISGCVVAAYNVYFDMRFLRFELAASNAEPEMPHLCLMYLRPMLGIGTRCPLQTACELHGIRLGTAHTASSDAMASAELMQIYLEEMRRRELATFADLAKCKRYKFVKSWSQMPVSPVHTEQYPSCSRIKSRVGRLVRP
jgi:DNA polymerase-3 subunit epsilon